MTVHAKLFPDGYARRAFSAQDVLRMQEAGILSDDERFELIDGEIVAMNAKLHAHEFVKSQLVQQIARQGLDEIALWIEASCYLDDDTILEPDLWLTQSDQRLEQLRGPDCLLVIEIADSSVQRDLGLKAPIYARCGVRDYWVVDIPNRCWHVHRTPSPDGFGSIDVLPWDAQPEALLIPGLRLMLPDVIAL
jgi:Uma2 family endonuclease